MDVAIHRALGLTDDEADEIIQILGREPNHLELAMYSVMWSEHCSYKSSRLHLRRLPTEGPHVLVGPGENAGVIDVGDGIAAAIRIESHNHPSAIEPYQGAATGVGGILRDIFTMGARPIAIMDPLRFGPLDDPRSRWIAEGVVSGVSGYGNSVGVPTVGGETVFAETYKDNPLVNVLCLGVLPTGRLVLGQASGVGNLAILLGSSTGRDGIGGVSVLASAGFADEETDAEKRPSVQVGDPYEEKRLIEACLELLDRGLVVGIQDLGGAGLVCATSETASRGGVGMDVDINQVHRREEGMEPFEVMISESQERMLAIVEPSDREEVMAICARWDIVASEVGRVTDGHDLRILDGWAGEVLAQVPASSLHDSAPLYDRPCAVGAERESMRSHDPAGLPAPSAQELADDLLDLVADTSWVWSQYDHQLFLNTVEGPGGDAVVLRLKHPDTAEDTGRGLALTTDGNHRWCAVDPRAGTALTVAESVMNLACVGARPLALVNCLNFGNPEHPEVMWELSESIDGMAEACRAFEIPVVGGNVSLYNESQGSNIDPTPVVGLLGMVDQLDRRPPGLTLVNGGRLLVLGPETTQLAGSRWAAELRGHRGGELPQLDPVMHTDVAELVRGLVVDGFLEGVHDVSAGGVGVALAELCVSSGIGVKAARIHDHAELFAEGPSRVVACVSPTHLDDVIARAEKAGVPISRIGAAGGDRFWIKDLLDLPLADLIDSWRRRIPEALGAGTTQG
ncbi:MAG: phosphoribosylformylglycinamidine synthase subunit PurL [Actinomycetia bacterium]|nr:phosphoribosylformylglycinamidine synthase subunit PurL [Actinomycetes bacterium]MCP3910579.1 phosphoribosylformylglycinamidine synthase subunit PurL [Actinomycetes bacterium]